MATFPTTGQKPYGPTLKTFIRSVGKITIDDLPTTGVHSAHRTGGGDRSNVAPEGSLAAGKYAIGLGYQILDADYQTTQDGVAVISHDATFDRTTNGTGLVSDYPSNILPQVDYRYVVGNGWVTEDLPTMEEWFSRLGGRAMLTIEPKNGAADVPGIASLIQKYALERSVFINTGAGNPTTMAAVVSAGCLLHVYGNTTSADITAADNAGAWLVELPYNASSALVAQALAGVNIKRVIAAPIGKRIERDAMTAGFSGYVSNSLGYLETVADRRDIIKEIAQQKVGSGWWRQALNVRTTVPAFATSTNVFLSAEAGTQQNILMGSLSGPKPATYSVDYSVVFGAFVGDTNTRNIFRIACPSDEGSNIDPDTRGYPQALRKNGQMILWDAPVGYGAAAALGVSPTTPAIADAGATARLRCEVTATTVALMRLDNPVTLSGTVAAGTVTSLPVTALTTAVASGTPLRLPNGQHCTASALASVGATAITVTSFTLNNSLPSGAPVYWSTGAVANTDWRGDYIWCGGSTSGGSVHAMELSAFFWGVPQAILSAAVGSGSITTLAVYPLGASIASGTRLRLPDGTIMTTSALANSAATSISVTSVTVPAMKAGDVIYLQ